MKHSFKNSLAKGKAGEALILELWPELTPIEGGCKGDFTLGPHNVKVELKSDQYDMDATPNMFIERWSDVDKQKPGSVWQAITHDCNLFVYFYVKNKTAFVFDTVVLKNYLDLLIPNLKPIKIYNHSWVTVGYKVPRDEVLQFAEIKKWT